MLRFLLLSLGFTFCLSLYAQNHHPEYKRTNHWFFGRGAGLDFSSGLPVADTSAQAIYVTEGTCSISDTAGNLLFYSDGWSGVYDKLHQLMPNSDSLNGNPSAYQSCLIVPWPRNPDKYFLFTSGVGSYCQTPVCNDTGAKGIYYSIIDMTLNNGFGDIAIKNEFLMRPAHEQLCATHHEDGQSVWVMAHQRNEEKYHAWLISQNGIDTIPVISEIGNSVQTPASNLGLKFSPDGTKLAGMVAHLYSFAGIPDSIELYDFNKSTGFLSNRRTFAGDFPQAWYYGFAFSKQSNFLYVNVNNYLYVPSGKNWTLKIDIANNSITVFDSFLVTYHNSYIQDFCLDANDNIYMPLCNTDTLSAIYNASSQNAQFMQNCLTLSGRKNDWCLPNFISSYFGFDPATSGNPEDVFYHGDESFCVKAFQLMKVDFLQSTITLPYFFREGQILLTNLKGETLFSHQIHSAAITSQLPDIQEKIVLVTLKDDLHICTQKYSQNK
jgi:hypothetical protein